MRTPRNARDAQAQLSTGSWLFTTRAGAERDLQTELGFGGKHVRTQTVAPALVVASNLPRGAETARTLTFARQGFRIEWVGPVGQAPSAMARLATRLQNSSSYCLQCWSADSDAGNALIGQARELGELLSSQLQDALPQAPQLEASALLGRAGSTLVQACLIDGEQLAIGFGAPAHALSLAPAGRSRMRTQGKLPSRSARKLEEALQWAGTAPGAGELCVDLGAAPGGWTHVLCNKGAKVLAVDPAALRPEVLARRNVKHVRQNAFQFEPEEPVDWLFCDMAYRPLEVAALLAKWGRRRWAQLLVANLKLPMTRKAEMVEKAREVLLAKGAWRAVRFRQLYHDRDEVTLCAHRT